MSLQLWRLDQQSREAVLNFKRINRHLKELEEEIVSLCVLINETEIPQQKVWADHQIRSIEHEMVEIRAGRLGLPEDEEV